MRFLVETAHEASGFSPPDVYFAPGYGRAVEGSDGGSFRLLRDGDTGIAAPYLLRPLPDGLADAPGCDAVSPYGYGGIWVPDGVGAEDVARFRAATRAFFEAEGVVSEFLRLSALHPGRERLIAADPAIEVVPHNDTVRVDLAGGPDAVFARMEGRSRTAIRKAEKLGYTVEERPVVPADLDGGAPFRTLYEATMRRVSARPYYLFPDRYYHALLDGLGPSLRIAIVRNARGEVGAAALWMEGSGVLHYHLSGSDAAAARDGANNLLVGAALAAAARRRLGAAHLGGGLHRDDALFRFKIGFGGERVPFALGRTILQPARYAALVDAAAARDSVSRAEKLATGYFPAYR